MCGINGIYLKQGKVNEDEIRIMNKVLEHRGPDDEGIVILSNIGLGHKRLSIIDLSKKGHQPMFDSTKRYVIVFNGEIYNYEDLKKYLKHVKFKSNTDTEVVVELYAKYGKDMLKFLNGMFAFAIYDVKEKTLFLARDRLGLKPLVFSETKKGFFFSSELPALLKVINIPKRINMDALQFYFLRNFMTIPEPYTIFNQIFKLEPAHYLIVKDGKIIEKKRYWNPNFSVKHIKPSQLNKLLKDAVNIRTVGDVPISVLLSGGVDSSTILAFLPQSTYAYSFGFSNDDEELVRAEKVARMFSSKLKKTMLNVDQIKELKKIIKVLGEPVYNLPLTYSYDIAKNIHSDGIKVALTGNGSDEIFYGYNGSYNLLLFSLILRILEYVPKPKLKHICFENNLGNNLFASTSYK